MAFSFMMSRNCSVKIDEVFRKEEEQDVIRNRIGICFVVCAFILPFVQGEKPGKTAQKTTPESLVADLGNPMFATRDRASRELWKLGRLAKPAVEKAVLSEDPEVARRAGDLLEKFNWGIFPDTPPAILEEIKAFRSNQGIRPIQAIAKLMDMKAEGVSTLALMLANEIEPKLRKEIDRQLLQEIRDRVPLLLFDRKDAEAEAVVQLGLTSTNPESWLDFALFYDQLNQLDRAASVIKQLTDRPGQVGASARSALAIVLHLRSQSSDAIQLLRKQSGGSTSTLLPSLLEDSGAWNELASEPNPLQSWPNLGLNLFRYHKANDLKGEQETLTGMRRIASEGTREQSAEAGLAMFLNGHPLEGIQLLRERNAQPRLLADVYAGRLMFNEVLNVMGEGRLAKEIDDEDDRRSRQYYQMRKGRVLAQMGLKDDAVQLFQRLMTRAFAEDPYLVRELLRAELRSGYFDLAAEHAGIVIDQLEQRNDTFAAEPEPFELLFNEDAYAARGIWYTYRKSLALPPEAPGATMRRVFRLLFGKPKTDEAKQARAILEEQIKDPRFARQDSLAQKVQRRLALAALARRTEDWDGVESHLRSAVKIWSRDSNDIVHTPSVIRQLSQSQNDGPRSWLFSTNETFAIARELGDFYRERERPIVAADVYLQAWRQYPNNPILLYLSGRSLIAGNDRVEGNRRIQLAHRVALGDAQQRGRFLHELCELGSLEDIRTASESTKRCAWYWTPWRGNVWNTLARAAHLLEDFEYSAKAIERNVHFLLKTPNIVFVDGVGYLSVPMKIRASRVRVAIEQKKIEPAMQDSKAILEIMPGHAEIVMDLIPAFDRAGEVDRADALFRQSWNSLARLRDAHPYSAWLKATASWIASGCLRERETALTLAIDAEKREPQIRWHKEVLAQAYFRNQKRAPAIDIARELIQLDHRNSYYRRLLSRYESGHFDSPLPILATKK